MAARRLLEQWPQRFSSTGVDLTGLAGDLDVRLERKTEAGAIASWRPSSASEREPPLWETDIVRTGAGFRRDGVSRFALAHELGHAVLNRERPGRVDWTVWEQERFANAFASQLLLSGVSGQRTRDRFCEATRPAVLLGLAKEIGVPVGVLMRRAKAENWLAGHDLFWFDIRNVVNRVTQRDRRPRIFLHVGDRERWYLPSNRSVRGLFGSDRWVHGGAAEPGYQGMIDLSRPEGRPTRLVHHSIPVEVLSLRLRRQEGRGMEILALARLRPTEAARAR